MVVYPAAGLIDFAKANIPVIVVDPGDPAVNLKRVHFIQKTAVEGLPGLANFLIDKFAV